MSAPNVSEELGQAFGHYRTAALWGCLPALEALQRNAVIHGQAAFILGQCAEKGEGVPKNDQEACNYYKKAWQLQYAPAFDHLKLMARTNVIAQHACGEICLLLNPKDEKEALIYFGKAARASHEDAVKCIKQLAESSSTQATARRMLGIFYLDIKGDAKTAIEWFMQAAALNDAESQHYLGICNVRGLGMPANTINAIEWFSKAAVSRPQSLAALAELAAEHAQAAYSVGQLYESGKVVEKDRNKAIMWYTKAASGNCPGAHYTLAKIYENEPLEALVSAQDVVAAYQRALECYRKAGAYSDSADSVDRIDAILAFLSQVKEPNFKHFAFMKLKNVLVDEKVYVAPMCLPFCTAL